MTDGLVKHYRNSREWLNDGECCGDKDSDGVCAAPACIFGEAVKELQIAADCIEKLQSEAKINNAEWERICNAYADENQRLSDYIEELKQQKYYLADRLYLATRRTDDNGDLLE